jgi:hypothetical protein
MYTKATARATSATSLPIWGVEGPNPYSYVSTESLTLPVVVFYAGLQPRTEPHSKRHGEPPPIASHAGTSGGTGARTGRQCSIHDTESWARIQCTAAGLYPVASKKVLCVVVIGGQKYTTPAQPIAKASYFIICSTQQGMYQRIGMAMFELPHRSIPNLGDHNHLGVKGPTFSYGKCNTRSQRRRRVDTSDDTFETTDTLRPIQQVIHGFEIKLSAGTNSPPSRPNSSELPKSLPSPPKIQAAMLKEERLAT